MLAMMRLIAWIHAHSTDGIVYGGDKAARDQGFMAWADASFADGFKALRTQESIIKFDGSVVAWAAKQQTCVALDTMESEYISASSLGRSLLGWLILLNDMGLNQGVVPCYEDSYIPGKNIKAQREVITYLQLAACWPLLSE